MSMVSMVPEYAMFPKDPRFACVVQSLRRGDFAAAQVAASELLAQCSDPAERAFLLNKRGAARAGLHQLTAARSDFCDALRAVPNYPPALTNLGNLSFEGGEYEAAIAHYQRAIAADERYAIAYVNLAAAYKRLRRFDEAVRALRQAQRLDARNAATVAASGRRSRRR
ncbi:MAG: tetratricopeptide repeat protein [Candidatus Eremiobacteraeota bacterium]|nr:tetratricopeptide repeat protein [Candidatus Eremiobacteraeota bacterium]